MNVAIVLCAGTGSRMNLVIPKQYMNILGNPLISYSLKAFEKAKTVDKIISVVGDALVNSLSQKELIFSIKNKYEISKLSADDIILGGSNRQQSVFNALNHISKMINDDDIVAIHDGVRALIKPDSIDYIIEQTKIFGCTTFAKKATNTLTKVDEDLLIEQYVDREKVFELETPQCFRFKAIYKSHKKIMVQSNTKITDDTSIAINNGYKVKIIENKYPNNKLTTRNDIAIFETYLAKSN